MTVNDSYELIQYICDKNQQGYISPDQFNLTINQAQDSYQAYLLGNFQQYSPGRPIARVELGQNQVVRQRLTPTIYNYNLRVDSSGFSPYPGDYLQADAMWTYYNTNRIRYVQQDALYSFANSVIDPVATNPIYLIEDLGFRFYPASINSAKLSYVRNAPDIVWGYDLVNDVPIYNETKSIQPVWDDASMLDIIFRALKIIGVNLQLAAVVQYSNDIKNNGQ